MYLTAKDLGRESSLALTDRLPLRNIHGCRYVLLLMKHHLAVVALLLAAALSACGVDEPASVTRPTTQPQESSGPMVRQEAEDQQSARASTRSAERGRQADSRVEAADKDVQEQEDATPRVKLDAEMTAPEDEAVPESELQPAVSGQSATPNPEPEPDEPPQYLVDVPAKVALEADVRVRPGLVWQVVDRLAEGEPVLVRHRVGDWLRVRYGDDLEGWTLASALDLGETEWWEVLQRPALPLTAEWRGEYYGVVGRSADGAEVRLLGTDGHVSSATVSEVALVDVDVTLQDLPVIVADETVVFSSDDIRVGEGKILPKANEWMWLPWGWLLAHNDEYIWQWRPETDELEFVRRPPGPARLSPSGRYLAIVEPCPDGPSACTGSHDVILLPLDGSTPRSLRRSLQRSDGVPEIQSILAQTPEGLAWAPSGNALMIYVRPAGHAPRWTPALVMRGDGTLAYFDLKAVPLSRDVGECYPRERSDDRFDAWHFRGDGTVAATMGCTNGDAYGQYEMVFSVAGEYLGFEPATMSTLHDADLAGATVIGAVELGEDAYELSKSTDRHSIVVAPASRSLFIYDRGERSARLIGGAPYGVPDWIWESLGQGPQFDDWYWDLYWHERRVAILARTHITYVAAGMLVELETARATPLQLGTLRTWPCLPTGGWSPDGRIFQIEFKASSRSERLDGLWIDGTAAPGGKIAQRQFVSSNGEVYTALRAFAHLRGSAPSHIAGWSTDGDWIAIGGHQEAHHCYTGA